jgi:hypothetical protein
LAGDTIKITDTTLTAFQRLCEEFGFSEFLTKPSEDFQNRPIGSSLSRMRDSLLSESFQFIVNESVIDLNLAESLIFPSVREQLLVDGSSRKFFVNDSGIESADIHSLQLLLSGETILAKRSQRFLNNVLGNENLERLFLNCSKTVNLSDLIIKKRIDLKCVDVSNLSVEAFDSLLLNEFGTVESEDSLLGMILKLGPDYRNLSRHIQIEFLSKAGLSLLDEHFRIPPESVWQRFVEWIARVSFLDSQM